MTPKINPAYLEPGMCGIVETPEVNNPAYLEPNTCGIVETPGGKIRRHRR
jgi:hypothetical protein